MYPKVWCTYRVVVFLFNPPAFLHFLSPLSSPLRIFPLNEKRQLEGWWSLQITLFLFLFYFVFAFLLIPIKTRYFARPMRFGTRGPSEFVSNWSSSWKASPSALSWIRHWDSLAKKPWKDVVFLFDERANCTLVSKQRVRGWVSCLSRS